MNPSALNVCSFESRKSDAMTSLIERNQGNPTLVHSMDEIPLEDNAQVKSFCEKLFRGEIDVIVFMTGVGATALLNAAELYFPREQVLAAFRKIIVVVRGPKPTVVLRNWEVPIHYSAPEPNTWHEIISVLDDKKFSVTGKHIAVQEYGKPVEEFYKALRNRGAQVLPIAVYRWALPDDTSGLRNAIHATIRGDYNVLMFTSAQQITHVLQIAEEEQVKEDWLLAASKTMIASVGPACTEALQEVGLPVDFESSPPKMGPLVKDALQAAPEILSRKG
ncbi:uroporphyrinogen-III synthase [Gimesia maris]|jgi:uroporphyrinogen-III synthase|uniref:Bifunctional uroporphyrinogen-III synthetase/response regulator domain protein n=2 Tax=Gimesia maris TaxID=122 RepID=A0ABX5YLG2_9PLAN|nr:uroporphyrinogen-III synthase [Gimesia maris]EDL57916.1 uroporphyrinogen III synthase, uroporhyrinogen decarboxylase [Gimesia maris DSM 8797]QDT78989.1 bifunctional uroporphyrinogen-III synthetase/response regulator domain protein [Gimesia maris]QDU14521.1 bifunctional uroporphyrinogen-III synthetase/response regulator domain protein [Gimesia maris]QEG16504.1 bifunctional uroporphyrinogen-III synthetase/response regulator domain protein [Gimesia maris]QGQ30314.1 uroporphyrinogen-III synthas|tara:strand:+ start:2948 stop:3778 length:831 start_codon:yes stop_codon:yes gene_type:complete